MNYEYEVVFWSTEVNGSQSIQITDWLNGYGKQGYKVIQVLYTAGIPVLTFVLERITNDEQS